MSNEKGFSAKLLDLLGSLKLTLFVFFTLAASSVIGTLLPQGTGLEEMEGRISPALLSIIDTLGLNNLYHTSWFRMLLLLLCVNLLVCTIDRLPKTIKLLKRQEEPFDSNKISKFGLSSSVSTKMDPEEAKAVLRKAVTESFGPLREIESEGRFCAVSETGRWSRLMVYGVHLSILLVLFGALTGSILGFKGFMNLPEGASSNEVMLTTSHGFVSLPFQIRCDKFDVSFYDTGAPKEFRSDLAVIEDGREVVKESIRVNDPLTYKGVTFYQSSYGTTLKHAEIQIKNQDTGKEIVLTLPYREARTIPGTDEQIQIAQYQDNMMRFGPALGIVLGKGGPRDSLGSWVLVDRPDFHGNKIKNYQLRVLKMEKSNYTGLQVKQDPGVWLVYFGFTLMLLGTALTFYSSHNKVWACVEQDGKGKRTVVSIAGRSTRGAGFGEKFDELSRRLNGLLKPEKIEGDKKKK